MAISRNERALLVIRDVVTGGRRSLEHIYQFAENASSTIVDNTLRPVYRTTLKLLGGQATEDNFIERISDLGNDDNIKAIDVIVILHGRNEELVFRGGDSPMDRIKYRLSCLNVRRKLRMLYSTACFGKSHANDFVIAGFDTAVGARKVNTNGATEFPIVAAAWATGQTLEDAIQAGSVGYSVSDNIAEDQFGFEDADSRKEFYGNENITITSEPGFNGKVYFFKGSEYIRWDLKNDAIDDGYPKPIVPTWHSFMGEGIDAAVNWNHGKRYFFKGNQYIRWDLKNNEVDPNYPTAISVNWVPFMNSGIDAALNWINNKVYFFKGNQYIRWDIERREVDSGYPKLISENWAPFMANGIDAAINWGNGKAYFFKGDEYIRWSIGVGMDEGYPKPIGPNWHSFMGSGVDAALLQFR